MKKSGASRDAAVTILTSGCHFNGKLYCRGSSRIGGRIEGQIVSEGLLIIEEGAAITASVKAEEAVVQGSIQGKLEASGRVELCNTSKFQGDITTPSLIIREGAQFNGTSHMQIDQPLIAEDNLASFDGMSAPDVTPDVASVVDKQPDVAVMSVPDVS